MSRFASPEYEDALRDIVSLRAEIQRQADRHALRDEIERLLRVERSEWQDVAKQLGTALHEVCIEDHPLHLACMKCAKRTVALVKLANMEKKL
jgi:hypothetical protein